MHVLLNWKIIILNILLKNFHISFFFLEKNLLNKQTSNRKKEVRNEFCNAFLIELDFFGIDKRI